jgi:asparagine synthase (glutamine-hydrolysing)
MAGYGWIDALKDESAAQISDERFKIHKPEWGNDVPETKEAYWYRMMFDNVFKPHCAETVKRWIPSWGAPSDPYVFHFSLMVDPVAHKVTMRLIHKAGS